jgi:O-antigen ligase
MNQKIQPARITKTAFYVILMLLPFGVAMQNILITLVSICLFLAGCVICPSAKVQLTPNLKRATLAMTGMIAVTGWSSASNLIAAPGSVTQYLLGHLSFYAMPLLFLPLVGRSEFFSKKGSVILAFGAMIWSGLILSQYIWGWKLSGVDVVTDEAFRRARGFYSHPLTLAYVSLIILPSILYYFRKNWKDVTAWCFLLLEFVALYFSMSRTVQAVSLIIFLWFIFTIKKSRVRPLIWALSLSMIVVTLITPNLITQRLRNIMDGKTQQWSEEKESHYPDDRLAFWHVHLNMIREKPFLGHGAFLDSNYRKPYYAAIGLPGFKKAYEAHNQYLQILAEGGLIALGFFLAWIYYMFRWCGSLSQGINQVGYQTILCFLLGGLTQNAFHDSEVRFAIMCVILMGFIINESRGIVQQIHNENEL